MTKIIASSKDSAKAPVDCLNNSSSVAAAPLKPEAKIEAICFDGRTRKGRLTGAAVIFHMKNMRWPTKKEMQKIANGVE